MSTNTDRHPSSLAEEDIHAYVDGFLAPERRAEIEAYLAAHPEDATRVAEYRKQNIQLHELLDGHGEAPIPPALQVLNIKLQNSLRRQRRFRKAIRFAGAAAVVAAVGVGSYSGYRQLQPADDPLVAFTSEAAEAHRLYTDHGGPIQVTADCGRSNVVAWLSQRLTGAPLCEPNLESLGFALESGRILPGRNGPTAQLAYRNSKGVPVTLYIGASRNAERTGFTFVKQGQDARFFWQNASFAYGLIGALDKDELLEIAQLISTELKATTTAPSETQMEEAALDGEGLPSQNDEGGVQEIKAQASTAGETAGAAGEAKDANLDGAAAAATAVDSGIVVAPAGVPTTSDPVAPVSTDPAATGKQSDAPDKPVEQAPDEAAPQES